MSALRDRPLYAFTGPPQPLLSGLSVGPSYLAPSDALCQVFLSHGLAGGLGVGLTYVPSFGVLSHYFDKRRALAMGIASSGSCIGTIVHPFMLNHLIESIGFAKALRASAGFNLGLLVIACSIMRTRLPPKEKHVSASLLFTQTKRFIRDPAYIPTIIG